MKEGGVEEEEEEREVGRYEKEALRLESTAVREAKAVDPLVISQIGACRMLLISQATVASLRAGSSWSGWKDGWDHQPNFPRCQR